ncbi:MAG: hypothetical protein JSS39_09690 [Nitrospira sp.]|nr:hypothetical protein [Nitrospira sp.]
MFGLAVLVALGLYIYLAKMAAQFIRKRTDSKLATYATVAIFVLIPTWDIIPGRLYHRHVCETEGGVKISKTVEVDSTYFLPNGRPDEKKLLERFEWHTTTDRAFSKVFHITKHQGVLLDKENGEPLGMATDFWYYGGWLHTTILIEAPADSCPQYPHHTVSGDLWRQVIRPKIDTQLGGK